MRILGNNNQEIVSPDLSLGKLVKEELLIAHHDAIAAVEERWHYETIAEYPNGGKDVQKVIDVPGVEGRDAWDEYEEVLRYVPFTEQELTMQKIAEMTAELTIPELLRLALSPLLETIPDATASRMVQQFPTLTETGALVKAGTRINWDGQLKRAAVDLWDTEENNPDNASNLWENLDYRNGIRVIPDIITAGLAFAEGEYGWWGKSLYKSKIANNVYTPAQYADGWDLCQS